ncbi:pyridoxal phosphate-dependent decarboxylase family protein [Candidatus Spongiihabitans sp.]|uniref:pyridoxal phosphate-dependent decarboxylase family protein n=1 Tax=Candidatus Spongiihabitans sp. TaxID=3101308 RepID=UPI003C6FA652
MNSNQPYETLDPEDWEKMRALAHQMVNDAIDYLESVSDRPVWQRVPTEIAQTFHAALPEKPSDPSEIYQEFLTNIFPYPMGNIHPRFWAWYMGNGTVMGALADLMASTMNSNMGGGNHSAAMVETQVTNWMKQVVEFPDDSSGLLVSGGSMANLVGITVARNVVAGFDVRKHGVQAIDKKLTVYASTEVHSSNQKAVELLGLGHDCFRKIGVCDDYTINLEQLNNAITEDTRLGCQPICVIASSGTVNTGAIDDLNRIADICSQHNIWFHVDGAIGATAMLSETVKPYLSGIERADSIAMDLHKWMHIPFEAGCVLVRDAKAHRDTFSLVPEYLEPATRGIASGPYWFSEYGLQLSRSFRALKIWMTIKEHGTEKLGRMISRNVEQAQYLGTLIEKSVHLQLIAPIGLDIVCYRYNPGAMEQEGLNKLNREILVELQEQGIAAPSYTTLNGVYCIRVAIANHRSRFEDFDVLAAETIRIGQSITN